MPYRYKEAFSLKHEIGINPNRELETDVVDKTPFFIRPYHVREKDKQIMEKNEKTLSSGYIKRFFNILQSSYINK